MIEQSVVSYRRVAFCAALRSTVVPLPLTKREDNTGGGKGSGGGNISSASS